MYTYFSDIKQVENSIFILLTLNKLKKINNKTPLGETGCLCTFCLGHCLMSLALYSGFSDLWGLHQLWALPQHLGFFVFECLGIPFFNSPLTQSVKLPMVTYPSLCSTWWLMGRHATPEITTCFPPSPYLGKQRISLGMTIILSMRLCPHT